MYIYNTSFLHSIRRYIHLYTYCFAFMYTYAYYRRYVQTYIHTYIHTYIPVGNVLSTVTLLWQMPSWMKGSNVTDDPVTCHTVHTVHVIPRHNISIHTYIHTYIHWLLHVLQIKFTCTIRYSAHQISKKHLVHTYLHCHTWQS